MSNFPSCFLIINLEGKCWQTTFHYWKQHNENKCMSFGHLLFCLFLSLYKLQRQHISYGWRDKSDWTTCETIVYIPTHMQLSDCSNLYRQNKRRPEAAACWTTHAHGPLPTEATIQGQLHAAALSNNKEKRRSLKQTGFPSQLVLTEKWNRQVLNLLGVIEITEGFSEDQLNNYSLSNLERRKKLIKRWVCLLPYPDFSCLDWLPWHSHCFYLDQALNLDSQKEKRQENHYSKE